LFWNDFGMFTPSEFSPFTPAREFEMFTRTFHERKARCGHIPRHVPAPHQLSRTSTKQKHGSPAPDRQRPGLRWLLCHGESPNSSHTATHCCTPQSAHHERATRSEPSQAPRAQKHATATTYSPSTHMHLPPSKAPLALTIVCTLLLSRTRRASPRWRR
jgi:hypothetical protein